MTNISTDAKRLKALREDLEMTQAELGHELGIKTTYDLERGKTKISGVIVCQLMAQYHINPLWLYGKSQQKYIQTNDKTLLPHVISVKENDNENMWMINQKAAAGYAGNINNPEYYHDLPAFSLPIKEYQHASFRCFQVEGYSMSPAILPEDWIIAEALENLSEIKDGKIYVVIDQESVRIKKVQNNVEEGVLYLISINPEYNMDMVTYDDIQEIWSVHSILTKNIEQRITETQLTEIYQDIKFIKSKMS